MRWLPLIALTAGLLLGLAPDAGAQSATTTLESRDSSGAPVRAMAGSVSANGRYVVFYSFSAAVPNDTNRGGDYFLRDRLTGQTVALNTGPDGTPAGGNYGSGGVAAISADGRYIAYTHSAKALGLDTTTNWDVIVQNRVTGARTRFPVPPGTDSYDVQIDGDGGRVAYDAEHYNTDPDQLYVGDTATGAITVVSQTPGGEAGDKSSFGPSISADGHWVTFGTNATNLVPGRSNTSDVLIRNLDTGALEQVSLGAGGIQPNNSSYDSAVSGDGCVVAFESSATNLVANDAGTTPKIFARDRCTGSTERVSLTKDAVDNQRTGSGPDISDDGCLVTFESDTVFAAPPSGQAAVLRDRCNGTTNRLDLSTDGEPGGKVSDLQLSGGSGRYVTFTSPVDGLVSGDADGVDDVFLRDRADHNLPPTPALTVTQDGRRVTADASASSDPDGPQVTGSIAFNDGSPSVDGVVASHTYATAGTFTVTATLRDSDGATATKTAIVTIPNDGATSSPTPGGGTPSPAPQPTVEPTPTPTAKGKLGAASLSRRRFKAGQGTTLTVDLDAAATVKLRFARAGHGHRKGGRCAKGAGKGKRCTRYTAEGTLTRSLPAGRSEVKLTGSVSGRALKPGAHRLKVSAGGASRTLTFVIRRPHR